jgi:hypothetical protein
MPRLLLILPLIGELSIINLVIGSVAKNFTNQWDPFLRDAITYLLFTLKFWSSNG